MSPKKKGGKLAKTSNHNAKFTGQASQSSKAKNPSESKGEKQAETSIPDAKSIGQASQSISLKNPKQPTVAQLAARAQSSTVGNPNITVKPKGNGNGRYAETKDGMFAKMPPSHETPSAPQDKGNIKQFNTRQILKVAQRPKKNGYGTLGRPIELISNLYKIATVCSCVYHYNVELIPWDSPIRERGLRSQKFLSREKRMNIFVKFVRKMVLQRYAPVYDGNENVFTRSPLPFTKLLSVYIQLEETQRVKTYEIVIWPVQKANWSNVIDFKALHDLYANKSNVVPEEVLLACNVIANYREPSSNEIQVGRSYFSLTQTNKMRIGEGVEIWFGYNQGIHLMEQELAMVVNIAAKAFHREGPLIDYASEVIERDVTQGNLKLSEIRTLEAKLRGVRIEVMYSNKRKYYIQGVTKQPASELMIHIDNRECSVAEYYGKMNFELKHPNLNCIHVRSNTNKTYLPFEVCNVIKGQETRKRLNNISQSQMTMKTAIEPAKLFPVLKEYVQQVNRNSGENMRSYEMLMETDPICVTGRLINPPRLRYNVDENFKSTTGSSVVKPTSQGTWRMYGNKFFQSPAAEKWILISFSHPKRCSERDLHTFAGRLSECAKSVGLDFGNLVGVVRYDIRDSTEKALEWAKSTGARFALVILPRSSKYDEVKCISDYELGFITQCIDDKHFELEHGKIQPKIFDDQFLKNLCLQINAKLGGVNHALYNTFFQRFIILGADTAPASQWSYSPSIASVVGSVDAFTSKYQVACRVQEKPDDKKLSQELIIEMQEMLKSIFRAFLKNSIGKIPGKIILFRGGVSKGQFESVLNYEVKKIRQACKRVFKYRLPITFIVVQKRHSKRLHPRDLSDGVGRCGNIPPGTVVDRKITHPRYFDYYLYSHEGTQGTSRPIHYTVLYDENNFSAHDLQKLSYHLCYMYNCCNRSISVPAPIKYADLAAHRAKKYAEWLIYEGMDKNFVRESINNMERCTNDMFYI